VILAWKTITTHLCGMPRKNSSCVSEWGAAAGLCPNRNGAHRAPLQVAPGIWGYAAANAP
jgi:hypothetical protein